MKALGQAIGFMGLLFGTLIAILGFLTSDWMFLIAGVTIIAIGGIFHFGAIAIHGQQTRAECPHCCTLIDRRASVCPHCRTRLRSRPS